MSYDFNFTVDQLTEILPGIKNPNDWFTALGNLLPNFDITSSLRVAMFIAQTGHESGNYNEIEENLNYSAKGLSETFSSYFKDGINVDDYANQPQKIANLVYSNRMGNGDASSNDGWNYRGRGILQVTGKSNYNLCSIALYGDNRLLATPELLLSQEGAVASACWYWQTHNLNTFSDTGNINEVTRLINGGYNGLADRQEKYTKAISLFNTGV